MKFATVHEANLILTTAKLLKRSPAGYISRIYFILRALHEMSVLYFIDVKTLTDVLTSSRDETEILMVLSKEFKRIKNSPQSEEEKEIFNLELLSRVYRNLGNNQVELVDNYTWIENRMNSKNIA